MPYQVLEFFGHLGISCTMILVKTITTLYLLLFLVLNVLTDPSKKAIPNRSQTGFMVSFLSECFQYVRLKGLRKV